MTRRAPGWWLAVMLAVGPAPHLARAQVSTDSSALDALRATPAPHTATPARRPAASHRAAPIAAAAPSPKPAPAAAPSPKPAPAAAAQAAQTVKPAKPGKPGIPVAPPAIAALPPPVVVPLEHPLPPPTVAIADDAPGAATPIQGGLRVTFGADRADLNPATLDALRQFAHAHADQPSTSISLFAYATGSPDDPSTPRRLSLERAMTARAVLLNEGIPSPRIYPRALGPTGGSVDPDRVDITTGTPTLPAATPVVATPADTHVAPPVATPVATPSATSPPRRPPPRGAAG